MAWTCMYSANGTVRVSWTTRNITSWTLFGAWAKPRFLDLKMRSHVWSCLFHIFQAKSLQKLGENLKGWTVKLMKHYVPTLTFLVTFQCRLQHCCFPLTMLISFGLTRALPLFTVGLCSWCRNYWSWFHTSCASSATSQPHTTTTLSQRRRALKWPVVSRGRRWIIVKPELNAGMPR